MSSVWMEVPVLALLAGANVCFALWRHIGMVDASAAGMAVFLALLAVDVATDGGGGE